MFKKKNLLVLAILFTGISSTTLASDHIDGAATIEDGQADLTDFYAFKTLNKKDSLTVVLNMYPGVKPAGHFSKKVSYDIFIRKAAVNKSPMRLGFNTSLLDALNINCNFKDPSHHGRRGVSAKGEVKCDLKVENKLLSSVSGNVGDTLENGYVRLLAGPRADAFFISTDAFRKSTSRTSFVKQRARSGSNALSTINVMSIAIELDLEKLNLKDSILALAAQSYTKRGGVYEPLDRVGRPEITNLSLHDFSGQNPLKRGYNHMIPFFGVEKGLEKYKKRLVENISNYDLLDKSQDWSESDLNKLSTLLLDDFLVIDLSGKCVAGQNEFFGIEKALIDGRMPTSCGGRKLTDDIMATLYGLYIEGPNADLRKFETGVTAPYQNNPNAELSDKFPYLARAGRTTLKQRILFKLGKSLQE